jgi:hypothetical protein
MILLSRAVTPWLLAGLLGFFFFVSARPCAAVGSRSLVSDAFSAEADLGALLFPEGIQLELNHVCRDQSSKLEIVHQWFRLTAPETYRAAKAAQRLLVEQANSAIVQFQQHQAMHRDWVVGKLNLLAETSRGNLERLTGIWSPAQPAVDAGKPDLPREIGLADFALESAESAYWSYYRDCERWGVELTRAAQQLPSRSVADDDAASNVRLENEKIVSLADDWNKNLESIFSAFNRTTAWLEQAFRSIEFAATESRVASRHDSMNRSN